jgi:hypothetical protein
MEITIAVVLCTPLPYARPVMYIRRAPVGGGGEPEPTRACVVMVAPPEAPRNAQSGKAKGRSPLAREAPTL